MRSIYFFKYFVLGFVAFGIMFIPAWAKEPPAKKEIIQCQKGMLEISTLKIPLGNILTALRKNCGLTIDGLKHRNHELVTISCRGRVEDVLKKFFRQIGVKNFAFEFDSEKLNRISVFPESKVKDMPGIAAASPPPIPADEVPAEENEAETENKEPEIARNVKVIKVLEGSQAEILELEPEDLIIEYGGVQITDTRQLVREVEKTSDTESVEMTVLRNGVPMNLELKGGKIGVQIGNAIIPKEKSNEPDDEER